MEIDIEDLKAMRNSKSDTGAPLSFNPKDFSDKL
jgi:hypothetical protein